MDIDKPKRLVRLTITQDTTCAWCFIGWRELELAIHKAETNSLPLAFQVELKPYRLDPSIPLSVPVNKYDRYVNKMGLDRFEAVKRTINSRGEQLGIDFTWDGLVRRNGNCHRVLRRAYEAQQQKGLGPLENDVQARLLDEIFTGFFERAEDIGDANNLAKYCEAVGLMPYEEALKFLESKELTEEVELLIDDAVTQGITGVPFTVINNKWAIQGGQTSEVYYDIFEKLAACFASGKCS